MRPPTFAQLRTAADVARDWAALLYTPVLSLYAAWLTTIIAFGAWSARVEAQRLGFLGAGLIGALCLIGLGTLFYQRRPTPSIRARTAAGELEITSREASPKERPAPEGRERGRRGPRP